MLSLPSLKLFLFPVVGNIPEVGRYADQDTGISLAAL